MGDSVAEWLASWTWVRLRNDLYCVEWGVKLYSNQAGLMRRRARVQIAATTLSGNSLWQTVHTRGASAHQARNW